MFLERQNETILSCNLTDNPLEVQKKKQNSPLDFDDL